MSAFPRILLLTWWPPDLRYAGGEFMRRLIGLLPPDSVRWVSLSKMNSGEAATESPRWRSFVPVALHWRLRRTRLAAMASVELAGANVASQIVDWASEWKPEVLWVLPELGAINIAAHLQKKFGIPMHLTLHDAFECAGYDVLPKWYMPLYARKGHRLIQQAASLDGISEKLIEHACAGAFKTSSGHDNKQQERGGTKRNLKTLVFPPSVSRTVMMTEIDHTPDDTVFRVGLCGSMRTGEAQWKSFVDELASMPQKVEIVAIGDAIIQAGMLRERGIHVIAHDYFDQDAELIAYLRDQHVHVGYAGVWYSDDRRLFARTSFSSKIVAFAAAGIPVVFDGPADSAAWRKLSHWKAGVLWDGSMSAKEALQEIRTSPDVWRARAAGSLAMCREELCLETNAERFCELIRETAALGKL